MTDFQFAAECAESPRLALMPFLLIVPPLHGEDDDPSFLEGKHIADYQGDIEVCLFWHLFKVKYSLNIKEMFKIF